MASNPNTFPTKTVWSKLFQLNRFKAAIYPIIAKFDLKAELQDGDTVKRTYQSVTSTGKMGGNGSYNTRALTNTEESLTINTKNYVAAQFPSWERLIWHMDNDQEFAQNSTRSLHLQTDKEVLDSLRAAASANSYTIDDGTLGGTSGNGITASVANIIQVFTYANEYLRLGNGEIPMDVPYTGNVGKDRSGNQKYAIVDARTMNILEQYLGGKNNTAATDVYNMGFRKFFMGFNIFVSNNLSFQAVLYMATQPTDGDTVIIAGVTFTFKTTLGSTAGNVLIGGSADVARANLATLIGTPFTTTANGVALTSTEIDTVTKEQIFGKPGDGTDAVVNISASNSNSADTLTITIKGVNKVTVSETLTAAADIWTTAKQTCSNIFCVSKCIDVVMKRDPGLDQNFVSGAIAKDFVLWNLYGMKVFNDQKPMIVEAKMDVSSALAPTQVPA